MKRIAHAATGAAYILTAATVAILVMGSLPAKADECSTNSPVNLAIATEGYDTVVNGGALDGTYNLKGTADCSDYGAAIGQANERIDKTQAMAAALSSPVWLNPDENFSVSGGVGFTDSEAALGATGLVRINRTFSAFGGGAFSVDGDEIAGKVGFRAGW
jgi:hypothetical protein